MDEPEPVVRESVTEDQLAITEYFASDLFRETKLDAAAYRQLDDGGVVLVAGILFGLLTLCAVWTTGVLFSLQNLNAMPALLPMMVYIDVCVYPIGIGNAFTVALMMFWRGNILWRVLLALAITVPAAGVFLAMATLVLEYVDNDFYLGVIACLIGVFVGAGTTAVLFELFSPYTLLESSHGEHVSSNATNLRSLFELTLLFALIFVTVSAFVGDENLWMPMMVCAIWSVLITIGTLATLIACLRDDAASPVTWIVAAVGCVVPSLVFTSGYAMTAFGWQLSSQDVVSIVLASGIGVILNAAMLALCVPVPRRCGWMCVNRRRTQ
jgi:hypothetical protein